MAISLYILFFFFVDFSMAQVQVKFMIENMIFTIVENASAGIQFLDDFLIIRNYDIFGYVDTRVLDEV